MDNTLLLDELVADPVSAVEKLAQQEGRRPAVIRENPAAARSLRQRPEQLRRSRSGERAPPGLPLLSCSTARCINGTHCRCWSSRWPKARCSRWLTPAEPKDIVGYVREASDAEVQQALTSAINNAPIWFATLPQERAAILERAAALMESQMPTLMGILGCARRVKPSATPSLKCASFSTSALLRRPGARRFR
ncbi:aldehyde dehydrogenase family protein [Klebsiella pneumoniae]|nr:aldehyde dehydrogenase family protein [Klebsiella pneumoniae]